MSQNDFTIANQTFPNTRADINSALQALASTSSGSSAPSTTFANQFFYNTTSNLLQIRNEDNDAFITIAELDQTSDNVEYFKSTAIRLARIEFEDGDDALSIADGGALTVSTSLDMNGTELILDADADTSITADTDDRIDIKVGNTDVAHITKNVIGGIVNRVNSNPFIINGNMHVDQRNAGASITANDSTFVVDRFKFRCSQASKLTAEQVQDVPAGQGYYHSTKITSSSAYSVGASDFFNLQTILEGQNITPLMFGSSTAKTITLSFWVKSSLTGNFAVALNNFQGSTRAYPAEYVIDSANTWEKKAIVIAGDTTGTWLSTNAVGVGIVWSLGFGSNFNGTKNAWNASDTNSFSGAVNLVATNAATLFITGVQLEVGDFDTTTIPPFQHESFGDSLLRCQRYLYDPLRGTGSFGVLALGACLSTTICRTVMSAPAEMRTRPTIVTSGNLEVAGDNFSPAVTSTAVSARTGTQAMEVQFNVGSGLTSGEGAIVRRDNNDTAQFRLDAEL